MRKETVGNLVSAFSVEGHSEDDGEGEAEALEHVRGWDGGAEAVEKEGCRRAFDMVGYQTLRRNQGGI